MKLRFHETSLRLRLRQSEVEQLVRDGSVEHQLHFGDSTLIYRLLASTTEDPEPRAVFENSIIEVRVPAEAARKWASSDQVGIHAEQPGMSILIEKDFRCLHKDGDSEDAYPNPDLPKPVGPSV